MRPLPHRIGLIVFDFDGVFTDNKVYTDQDGRETVMCDRRDGLGIVCLRQMRVPMFILSTEKNPVVLARAKKLGLDVTGGCHDKAKFLTDYLTEHSIDPATVIYVGNDLNDIKSMEIVGYSIAPADAHPAAKQAASLVLAETGGNGAVRRVCDLLLEHLQSTGELIRHSG